MAILQADIASKYYFWVGFCFMIRFSCYIFVLDFSPDLISLLGRWYRGCRQVGRQFGNRKPKWECATSTNTEGYWTTLRDCLQQELQSQDNCLHDQRKLNRSENPETAWILL